MRACVFARVCVYESKLKTFNAVMRFPESYAKSERYIFKHVWYERNFNEPKTTISAIGVGRKAKF